jgi:isoamyl acetate esterase
VPLAKYRENLTNIITHSLIKAHSPKMILISPPKVEEYKHIVKDKAVGYPSLTRFVHLTKSYADTCVEAGKELNIARVDTWSAFIGKAG